MEEIRRMTEDAAKELLSTLDKMHESELEFERVSSESITKIANSLIDKRNSELCLKCTQCAFKYVKSKFWNRWYYKKKYFKAKEEMETFCIKLKEFEDGRN